MTASAPTSWRLPELELMEHEAGDEVCVITIELRDVNDRGGRGLAPRPTQR